ncbi:MAG: hypothetical protein RLW61_06420 [Gammaproteobacteria bacterium]
MTRFAVTYFALVFSVGFVLGTVRVLVLVPLLGELAAELAELPLMVLVAWLSASALVGRTPGLGNAALLGRGALALALMLACELGVVVWLRRVPLGEYFATRDPLGLAAYAAALIFFALAPWLASQRRRSLR